MADDADRAQAQMEWLEQFRTHHRRKHVMRASPYCVDCGLEIDYERKKAIPSAERCRYCQEEKEKNDKFYKK